ncbi:hypothetical protein BY996DRAFT_6514473 [Phakopsora pachyrhizi]|nr:hypothetical protein BY996DRAFT_6453414 [Phakopsora pachyrhizi]KAI8451407.1 hypothetical protein BY996DRAFT_6514473 [Phakopsora pachyrhizi]
MDTGVGGSEYGGKEGVVDSSRFGIGGEPDVQPKMIVSCLVPLPSKANWIHKFKSPEQKEKPPASDLQEALISIGRQLKVIRRQAARQTKLDQMEGDVEGREKSLKRIDIRDQRRKEEGKEIGGGMSAPGPRGKGHKAASKKNKKREKQKEK